MTAHDIGPGRAPCGVACAGHVFAVHVRADPGLVWTALTDPGQTGVYLYGLAAHSTWVPGDPDRVPPRRPRCGDRPGHARLPPGTAVLHAASRAGRSAPVPDLAAVAWRRITIRRQSGGGSLRPSPVMSPWTRRSPPDSGRRAFPSTAPAVGITSLEGCDCTLRDRP
jgi:hypothetical protein